MKIVDINIDKIKKKVGGLSIDFVEENQEGIEFLITKMLNGGYSVKYGTISTLGALQIYSSGILKIESSYNKRKFKYVAVSKDVSNSIFISPVSALKFGLAHLKPIENIEFDSDAITGTGIYNATLLNDFYATRISVKGMLKSHCFVPNDDYYAGEESRLFADMLRWAIIISAQGDYE